MKNRDFERIRVDVKQGWELSEGLIESPHVKGTGPLTAVFNYNYYEDGVKIDKRVVTPSMKALTKEQLLDGSEARIHQIPESLVDQALAIFARAAAPAQVPVYQKPASNDDLKRPEFEPQVQMAASVAKRTLQFAG